MAALSFSPPGMQQGGRVGVSTVSVTLGRAFEPAAGSPLAAIEPLLFEAFYEDSCRLVRHRSLGS